jgi:hypothetical protein
MQEATGTHYIEHGGARYALRLSMRGIAQLQSEFGRDIAGILSGETSVPDFKALLRVVEISLAKGQPGMTPDQIATLADEIATTDLVGLIVQAAFPEAGAEDVGNAQRARKRA